MFNSRKQPTIYDSEQTKNQFQVSKNNFQKDKAMSSSGHFEDHVDVILMFLPKQEKEFLQNIRVIRNSSGDIDLCDLLRTLKGMTFPIERNVISYYSYSTDMYVYCGNDPIPQNSTIPALDTTASDGSKQVTIRIRQVLTNMPLLEPISEGDNIKLEGSINFTGEGPNASKQKRTKERKIGEILDKVLQWRRLYTGVIDPATGQTIKLSLDEAASRVNISKKSLDDYLLQIRFGKKYGFNFNDHFNERVGVLRTFVKKHKGKKDEKIEESSDGLPEKYDSLTNKKKDTSEQVKIEPLPMSKKSKKI
jgi:hypothetical protein